MEEEPARRAGGRRHWGRGRALDAGRGGSRRHWGRGRPWTPGEQEVLGLGQGQGAGRRASGHSKGSSERSGSVEVRWKNWSLVVGNRWFQWSVRKKGLNRVIS